MKRTHLKQWFHLLPGIGVLGLLGFAVAVSGCGSWEESTDNWETTQPAVSENTLMEYRIDSLKTENQRLKDQLEAVAAENRKLTARTAEMETKVAEAAAMAPAVRTETAPPRTANLSSSYEGALDQFRARDYQGAIASFESLLQSGIEEKLADNCKYWIAESYYGLRQFRDAITHFQTVLDLPRSSKKADALLMMGNSYLRLGSRAEAKAAFERVISDFPASPLVDKARERLSRLN